MHTRPEEIFVQRIGKHFVLLTFTLTDHAGASSQHHASCFVVEMDGAWVLVTAGHIINAIERVAASGGLLSEPRLVDVFAGKAFPPIPITFDLDEWATIEEPDGTDYAALRLSQFFEAGLKAAGVVPLAMEHVGASNLAEYNQAFIVGVPGETFKPTGKVGTAKLMMIPIREPSIDEQREQSLGETVLAALVDQSNQTEHWVNDVSGMSGCPVIGIKKVDDKTITYWAIGVQSSWFPSSRVIRFCPLKRFVLSVREALRLYERRYGSKS